MITELKELIEILDRKNIEGLTFHEQMQIYNSLRYLEEYQKIGTISEILKIKKYRGSDTNDGGLRSCPFCGEKEKVSVYTGRRYTTYNGQKFRASVICNSCGTKVFAVNDFQFEKEFNDYSEAVQFAVEFWNRDFIWEKAVEHG